MFGVFVGVVCCAIYFHVVCFKCLFTLVFLFRLCLFLCVCCMLCVMTKHKCLSKVACKTKTYIFVTSNMFCGNPGPWLGGQKSQIIRLFAFFDGRSSFNGPVVK